MFKAFRKQGGGIPAHSVPDWAIYWRTWYSPDGYADAVEYTDDPATVETPASVGKYGAAFVGEWSALGGR